MKDAGKMVFSQNLAVYEVETGGFEIGDLRKQNKRAWELVCAQEVENL